MAFGGRELRLILSVQSYGTSNIARLRRDIAQLSTATEAANARQMAQARLAQRALRVGAAEQDLKNIRAGLPALAARNKAVNAWGRANASVLSTQARQMTIERQLFDVETKRQALNRKIGTAKFQHLPVADIRIMERGLESLNMQEGVLNQNMKALNSTLAVQKTALHQADLAYKELVRTKGVASAEAKAAAVALQAETAAYNQAAAAVTRMNAAVRAKPFEEAAHSATQVAHLGRTAQFAGLITTAAFGLASNSFADFTERASLAGTQMRDITAPMSQAVTRSKELQDRILDLGMQFPASATEMSEAAYEIFSSMNIVRNGVVNTAKGFQLLTQANKAAVAGGVELEEATDAMIVVLNNFDPALNRSSELLNQMFSVVRFGKMRLNDLGAAMKHLAPVAKTVGLEFSDVGAAFATLTILSGDMETASTGLARAIELFRLPAFQKGFEKFGMSITDAHGRLLPLNQIIEKLIENFPEMATGQKAVIETLIQVSKASGLTKAGIQGTVQGRRAIAGLVTAYDLYQNVLKNVTGNQKEFQDALKARLADPGVQWQIFLRQMQTLILVIGREALPVFLMLGKRIEAFIKWFKELNPQIRGAGIRVAALLGVFLLLSGTVLSAVGSMVALRNNMALMSIASEGVTKRFMALRLVLGSIALFSLFILVAELDGVKSAIIATTTAWLLWKTTALQSLFAVVTANRFAATAVKTTWRAALIATGWGIIIVAAGIAVELIMKYWDQFRSFFIALMAAIEAGWQDLLLRALPGAAMIGVGKILKAFFPLNTFFAKLSSIIPGIGEKFSQILQPANALISQGEKLMAGGGEKFSKAFAETYSKSMDDFERARKRKNKKQQSEMEKEFQRTLKGLLSKDFLKAQEDFVNQLNPDESGMSDAAKLAGKRAEEVSRAYDNMQEKIGSAVDNLTQIYDRFEQENEQALGTIFQGPTMQGIFGDVFRQINDQVRQFGIQIPIPFKILQQDMDQQLTYFRRWRSGLDKLLAHGVPLEMIAQIRALGPEAIPMIEGLLGASPKQLKAYVKDFKTGQTAIKQAAKADMDRQLKDWQSHGKNIAWQLISGLASDPAQAKLRMGFRKYVVATFGEVLAKEMAAEIKKSMAQALKEAAATAKTAKKAGKAVPPEVPPQQQKTLQGLTKKEAQQRLRKVNAQLKQLSAAPSPEGETSQLLRLQKRAQRLRQHLARLERDQEIRARSGRIRAPGETGARVGSRKPPPTTNVTNEGDNVIIRADGATPAAVTRALNKHKFRKKAKNRRTGSRR